MKILKIGLFTDTHYCGLDVLEQDRRPKRAYAAVKTAYDEFKRAGVNAVICLGDLIHYNDGIETSKTYLERISALIASYGVPTYLCMGNHDNEVLDAADFEKISGVKTAPCIVEDSDSRLVLLDASYTPDGVPFKRHYVDWTLSYVPSEELAWLDESLSVNKKCAVFIHQNIDTNVEKNHIVSNADEINAVIAKHSVTGVYQGHCHCGANNIIGGVPYITLRAMCIGDETNFMVIEV